MRPQQLALILLIAAAACTPKPHYEKSADGITVYLSGQPAKLVQLKVISEQIIQVRATPDNAFPSEKSLMIVDAASTPTAWEVSETDDAFTVSTATMRASIRLSDGSVSFIDKDGKTLLAERARSFEPFKLDTLSTYHVRQQFEGIDGEGYYGLGAHQNGQMNYSGEDVDLVQHNIVDVVPFVYSSSNYGILWDNYSAGKFGDPREYEQLSSLKLFTRDGQPGGLTADYYVADEVVRTAVEDKINIEYLETPEYDSFPQDVSRKGKVVWEGSFISDKPGAHKFQLYASNYFKVWVDDSLILDKWRQNWNPWTNKFNVEVKGSEQHRLKVEWLPDGGYLSLKHLDPLPEAEQQGLSFAFEVGNEINYYFIAGNSADKVISGYRTLTGQATLPPKWALGFWQSRERYRNQKELVDVVETYRRLGIPMDNIVLDWQYWKDPDWGTHEFDATRFPYPAGMVSDLHALNARIMISVWPKFNKGTPSYDAMNQRGYLYTRNIEKGRKDWVGPGYQNTFYDAFNEEAGKFFWNSVNEKLHIKGFDAYWMDATEPDMHSNLSLEERKLNMSPTALGPGAKYFNAYSLVNSKNIYEGQRASTPDQRVFILTRSAYAGQQRYASATWSGDIASRWSDFQDQIAAGINFSLSGIPYWTMDIGGFAVERKYENAMGEILEEWQEMNTRWFQFGAFCPIFRSHGQFPFREIYNIAPAGTKPYTTMVYYDKLRYRLMPYIYSIAGHTYFDNYTIMRGLVMDFGNDPAVGRIADEYMFGPALLINPVYKFKARERSVYLPKGATWYDLYSGLSQPGGSRITAPSPLERMPIYVKSGSIIPTGPAVTHTGENADPIIIYVYTGADGSFNLYDDEGTNYNYENNMFSIIPLKYTESEKMLTIGARFGGYNGMPETKTIYVRFVTPSRTFAMDFSATGLDAFRYDGSELRIMLK